MLGGWVVGGLGVGGLGRGAVSALGGLCCGAHVSLCSVRLSFPSLVSRLFLVYFLVLDVGFFSILDI